MGRFAVCAIFKDEAAYLAEWLAFHLAIGFDYFVLYDNGSTDGGRQTIEALPFARHVTLIDWPERPGQTAAYAHFYQHFRHDFEWTAYIDIDEFIHPLASDTIRDVTALAGQHPAILMNWLNFGPDGHMTRQNGLVTETYLRRLPYESNVNRHVKTLARCAEQVGPGGPHVMSLRGDPCNGRGETVPNRALQNVACHEGVVVNHYYTKSLAEWQAKVARGRATVTDDAKQRNVAWFEFYVAKAVVPDDRMLRWSNRVRAWLAGAHPAVPGAPG